MTERNQVVPVAATAGLFAAWAVHDAEEWVTIGPWARERDIPIPDRVAHTAIGLMAALVGSAAVDGARTGGRSEFYQAALLAYGLHGLTHLATSAVVRGYSPGVVTVPITVIPFWLWAARELGRAGVRRPVRALLPRTVAVLAVSIPAVYGAAVALERVR